MPAGEAELGLAPLAEDQHDRPGEVWLDVKVAASAAHHRSAEERWSVPELCGDVSSEYLSMRAAARELGHHFWPRLVNRAQPFPTTAGE